MESTRRDLLNDVAELTLTLKNNQNTFYPSLVSHPKLVAFPKYSSFPQKGVLFSLCVSFIVAMQQLLDFKEKKKILGQMSR